MKNIVNSIGNNMEQEALNDMLSWAAGNGHVEVVKLLLEHKADIHAYDDWALRYAKTDEIKVLLRGYV